MRGRYGTDAVVLGRLPFRRPLATGRDFPSAGKVTKGAPGDHPSDRSGCFDWKKRSDRTPASIRGSFANRGCEACEVGDDEDPSFRPGGPISPPLDPPAYVAWFRYSVKNSRETVLWITESGEDGGSMASSISTDRTSMNSTPSGAPRQLPRRGSLNLNGNRPFLPSFSVSPGGSKEKRRKRLTAPEDSDTILWLCKYSMDRPSAEFTPAGVNKVINKTPVTQTEACASV